MGIDIKSMTPSQAKELWRDMQAGKAELSKAEEASFKTKFGDYIKNWEHEQDETNYTYRESGEERLDIDDSDVGLGLNKDTATGVGDVAVAAGTFVGTRSALVSADTMGTYAGSALKNPNIPTNDAQKVANKESGSLLVMAALQLASALWTLKNSPNKDAVEACKTAQNELYTEQAILAEQVMMMEDMQMEMETLQEEAEATNEEGQGEIAGLEGAYHYYYQKYQNGTATSNDIAFLNLLSEQMKIQQATTTEETTSLNSDIAAIGDNYEDISANIETTNEFTDFVSEIDVETRNSSILQGFIMTASFASAAFTAGKCIVRATTLTASIFGAAAAVMYYAAAAMSAGAAAIFGAEAYKQFTTNRETADETIDIRKETQDLSTETSDFQEISTEFWEESVDATAIDNLFTQTPTYAEASVSANNQGKGKKSDGGTIAGTNVGATGGSRATEGGTGGTTGTGYAGAGLAGTGAGQEDDGKNKKKV